MKLRTETCRTCGGAGFRDCSGCHGKGMQTWQLIEADASKVDAEPEQSTLFDSNDMF